MKKKYIERKIDGEYISITPCYYSASLRCLGGEYIIDFRTIGSCSCKMCKYNKGIDDKSCMAECRFARKHPIKALLVGIMEKW